LNVAIAMVIVIAANMARKAISPEIAEIPTFLKIRDFKASTAYVSGFTFAKALSHGGKLAIG